jgi:tRNA dimethylallyltransferase
VAPPLVAIVGPTAAGKSALGLRLARARGGEVVSCDSLQVYRGLNIGSAKATRSERGLVPHHLLDVVEPTEAFSAAEYARLAREALADLRSRGKLPVVVGGTGLYLRALLQGLFAGPSRDDALRARLEAMADRFGTPRLHRLLARVDPRAAARIQAADRVRIVRALEVFRATGEPISRRQERGAPGLEGFDVLLLGLDPDRGELRGRVEERTRTMLAAGLVEEVRGLLARGLRPDARPLASIGYRQALSVVRGEMTPEEAETAIVRDTMRLARRQMTWFRHQAEVTWFRAAEEAFEAAVAFVDGRGSLRPGDGPAPLTP